MSATRSHPSIDKYLRKLRSELSHLGGVDRDDISREIEEHIRERWETDSGGTYDDESLRGVLGKMGTPEYIAAQYCEQRGWARPPKKHTLQNAVIVAAALIVLSVTGVSYIGMKFILAPFMNLFRGSIVEVDDQGVRIMNDAISVTEDGVKIRGIVNIDASNEGVKIGDSISFKNIRKLMKEKELVSESGNLLVPATDIDKVALDFIHSRVGIKGAKAGVVEIKFTKKVYGDNLANAKEALRLMDVSHEREGNSISIGARDPYFNEGIFDSKKYPNGVSAIAYDVEMTIPEKVNADVDGKNCEMSISGIRGNVNADVMYGSADIADIGGDVSVDGKYGRLALRNIAGSATVDAKYGKVSAEDIKGDLTLDNNYGKSKIMRVGGAATFESKYGNIEVEGVAGDVNVDSKYGDIDLKLLPNYGFRLEGESKYGSIKCDFPTDKDGDLITATVGDGKKNIVVSSTYGSVNIKK